MKFKEYFNRRKKTLEDFVKRNVMPLNIFVEKLKGMKKQELLFCFNMWKQAKAEGYMNADFYLKEIEKHL